MLVRTAQYLHKQTDPQSDTEIIINNALIEAFAVHARNVADLLKQQQSDRKNVHASQFFATKEDWTKLWDNNEDWKTLDEQIKLTCDRVHKEIVHLGKERIYAVGGKKKWELIRVINLIAPRLRTFAEKAQTLPAEIRTFISDEIRRGLVLSGETTFSTTSASMGLRRCKQDKCVSATRAVACRVRSNNSSRPCMLSRRA